MQHLPITKMQKIGYNFTMNNYYMFTPNRRHDNVLFLYQAGYERCKANSGWSGERDFYLIHFVISGKGEYRVNGKVYPLTTDDAFVIFPGEKIDYRADAEQPYEYCWIGFNGVSAREIVEACGFVKKQLYVRHVDKTLDIGNMLLSVCCEQDPDIKQFLHTYSVFYDILGRLVQQDIYFDRREFSKDYALIAAEYIEQNYGSFDLSVDSLAKYLTLSRSQVYRIFKMSFDVSPQEYIANFRLEKGCNLIKKTNKSVSEIAEMCGYRSVQAFIERYKRAYKCTPTEGRKMEREVVKRINNETGKNK